MSRNGYRNMSLTSAPQSMPAALPQSQPSQQHLNAPSQAPRSVSPSASSAMSRAERFEDEKRRLIASCFSKLDANGQLAESYITHIRITEDAVYPSAPPPPDSVESNKKPRLIIIAVRSTGRVRMHKARENNNGSFSIGKTWNLEEMSAIETFSSADSTTATAPPPPQSDMEAQHRQWAGSVGFTVTITKPYYWQAGTSKEKDFFIASAVKIYRKYTKGLAPELKGFDEKEKDAMLGTSRTQQPQTQQQLQQPSPMAGSLQSQQQAADVNPGMRAESRDTSPVAPPQPPFAQRPQSREESRYRQSPGPPPSIHDDHRPGSAVSGSRQLSETSAPSRWAPPPAQQVPRPFASQEHMRSQSPSAQARMQQRQDYPPRPQQQQQGLPMPPSLPSARSESPGGSSLASSLGVGRPQVRTASPPRDWRVQPQQTQTRELQHAPQAPSQQHQQSLQQPSPQQTNGTTATAGANLFAATRQRWMNNTQEQTQQDQRPLSPGAPRLPPIQTSQPISTSAQPNSAHPKTGASEASSAAFDFGDAVAVGAITSFWGPEPDTANAVPMTPPPLPVTRVEEPTSPATPERSTRRPQLHDTGPSITDSPTAELRPPPLRSSTGARTASADQGDGGGSLYGTPRDGGSALHSAQPTPRSEEPPEIIRPLAVRDKWRQSADGTRPLSSRGGPGMDTGGQLAMPGGFATTPSGPSPAGTPAAEVPNPLPTAAKAQADRDEGAAAMKRATDEQAEAAASAEREREQERSRLVAQEEAQAAADAEVEASYRPGLGPMIKKNAVRDKFKKAAITANAFKPRPGGAAEKIMKAKAERDASGSGAGGSVAFPSGEVVDGVSGFVPRPAPAPAPAPAVSGHDALTDGPREREIQTPQQGVPVEAPKVQVTSPLTPVQKPLDSPGIMGLGLQGVQLTDDALPSGPLGAQPATPEQLAKQEEAEDQAERDLLDQRELRKPQVKIKRRSASQNRKIAALGIDPALLEDKALDFEATLTDFGFFGPAALDPKSLHNMEADIRREQDRLGAGSWLSQTDAQREEKITAVEGLFDRAIAECDELEGLLTLYSVELGSLNEDVAFIEAQSQGLQVQSANQKGLVRELEALVETLSLDRRTLEPLRQGDLGDVQGGLVEVEMSLVRLWRAMVTIDPSLQSGRRKKAQGRVVSDDGSSSEPLSGMRAVKEKKEVYEREAGAFVERFVGFLDQQAFPDAFAGLKGKVMRPTSSGGPKRMTKEVFGDARRGLWVWGPVLLFVREMNAPGWGTALRVYSQKAGPVYGEAFRENLVGWKGAAKMSGQEEADLLFTTAEKDESGSAGGVAGVNAARKLTIKRSQTMAKTLRTASGGKSPVERSRGQGQMMTSEVFGGAMDEMAPLISQEQNFIVELFHATSAETQDFAELVAATPPDQRQAKNLLMPRPTDPDREMAKQVTAVMEQLFGSFAQEMGVLLEWSIAGDPIQGVGVMACLSRHAFYLQESSQEFLLQLLEGLSSRLQNLWSKFVDEQVRAIEDTKVKVKKRKGVIGFMKTFPHFAAAVENVFSAVAREEYDRPGGEAMYEVRRLVDETYARINRAMFDSLKVIAKESPGAGGPQQRVAGGAGAGEDPEDKEVLNYHILLIENMNHHVEEVDDGGKEGVLAEWRGKAMLERAEALEAYVGRVITRPLGKLLDFLDSTESLLALHPTNPLSLATRPSSSRKTARNLFAQYDVKEIRRGVDTLRKRIEKHFGDADEEVISRNLVALVGKECERAYERTIERMERLVREVWPPGEGEKGVEVEFGREDVRGAFKSLQRG
ncbi:hypothetical protein LTR29_003614 [Friedmanniomyces endolithicus]|nr:hypothetical protein LTR29_003614 [Friedmanniomyces endolithicus]